MESTLQALMPNCRGKKFQFVISHLFWAAGLPLRGAGIKVTLPVAAAGSACFSVLAVLTMPFKSPVFPRFPPNTSWVVTS